MVRLGLTFGFLACATAAGIAGCGTAAAPTNNGTSGTTGTSGAGGTTGTSGTGATGATGTSGTTPPAGDGGAPLGTVILDDMTMQQSVLGGSWYTYSDRTEANSEPPIILGGVPGMITPVEGANFFPALSTDPKAPTITVAGTAGPQGFRECSGGGDDNWGAGFGLDLKDNTPDGGPVVFNTCINDAGTNGIIFDTSGQSANVGIPVPFDAKTAGYTGIAFYGTSFGTVAQSVNIQMDDERTSPWGGICSACQNGGKCAASGGPDGGALCPCSDNFIFTALFPAGSWKQFSFHFTDKTLKTANWSTQGLTAGSIDTTSLYNLHFQLTTSAGKALPAYDVGVAYVTWLTN